MRSVTVRITKEYTLDLDDYPEFEDFEKDADLNDLVEEILLIYGEDYVLENLPQQTLSMEVESE